MEFRKFCYKLFERLFITRLFTPPVHQATILALGEDHTTVLQETELIQQRGLPTKASAVRPTASESPHVDNDMNYRIEHMGLVLTT